MTERFATRRDLIKTIAAAGATGVVASASRAIGAQSSQPSTRAAPSTSALQVATIQSATMSSAAHITGDDLATTFRTLGWDFNQAECELATKEAQTYRTRMLAMRGVPLDPRIEPAVHFDPRLRETVVPTGKSSCTLSDRPLIEFDANDLNSLAFASVADLARLIHAKKITSTQLTRMFLDRLKKYGPRLLCVVTLTEELALKQATRADEEIASGKYRGPLHGIPYGAKDLLATKGVATTWGVSPYKDQTFDFDATVIARLEDAGAVLVAKLSLGELAMGDVWFGGVTRTPWDSSQGSSGSSAGPGSATAAGLVGFSIGSETLGSIVSPCVVNGTTGLRPTWGRVSRYGAMPLTWTMDKLGPMCRGVEDCALVLGAIAGADANDPTAADVPFAWDPNLDLKSIRIGFNAGAFNSRSRMMRDETSKKIYTAALDQIRKIAGKDLVEVTLPKMTPQYEPLAFMTIQCESASSMSDLLVNGRIRDLVQQKAESWPNLFRAGAMIPAADYLRAQRFRAKLMREMHDAMKDVDVMVNIPFAGAVLPYTNLTGHPTLVTRCGMRDSRPTMIEFVGRLYREDAIARVALEYERANDWQKSHPDVDKLPETPPKQG